MKISDRIHKLKETSYDNGINPSTLIITIKQIIELNKEIGYPAGKALCPASTLDVINTYIHGSVFGLDVLIGKTLEVKS